VSDPEAREFLFIRHAESEANCGRSDHCDCDLTDAGREHAKRVGRALADHFDLSGFRGIVSPYKRTRETAELISRASGIQFEISAGVREWGKDCEVLGESYPEESLERAAIRLEEFLQAVESGSKLVIVSHATPILLLVQILVHGSASAALKTCIGPFWEPIKNCGVTHVNDDKVICLSKLIA
jgi:broad specificity phosphatase PhoE